MKRAIFSICVGAGMLALLIRTDLGQSSQGSILGVVHDQSGSIAPGARVEVTHIETGLKRLVSSDESGNFEILALPRGNFDVRVSLANFKIWTLEKVALGIGERKRIFPILEIGEVTESVTVQGQGEVMQTEEASLGGSVQQVQLRELPINGRNPVSLVTLIPGMRITTTNFSFARGSVVQGGGTYGQGEAEFQVDGVDANDPMYETGFAIPNVDTIAEFQVETSNFDAELGRGSIQVLMATKSGSNDFHGTLWNFHRNHVLDARNTFATRRPKFIRNQFGFTVGGPIIRNKTHFFGSFEGALTREERIYNEVTVTPAMLQGDFSSLSSQIRDPRTGQPFPGNRIPADRVSSAAKFFFPYILLPNAPSGRFQALAPIPDNQYQAIVRVDHQLTGNHRIFARWITQDIWTQRPQYRPDMVRDEPIKQHNLGLTYNYNITPTTLLTLTAGGAVNVSEQTSPDVGKENLTQNAGIQGFPTEGRAEAIGLPQVAFTGYAGFQAPSLSPLKLWGNTGNGKVAVSAVRGKHTIGFGYDINLRSGWFRHASSWPNGGFTFNGQFSGNGFADYLLGLPAASQRNYPLNTFGVSDNPYHSLYVQDHWKISPNLTINLGARLDYWPEKRLVRGTGSAWHFGLNKIVVGEDKHGQVDFTSQYVSKNLAKFVEGLWIPVSQAGVPAGLQVGTGAVLPRLGVAWRPIGKADVVIRAGYGIFGSNYVGGANLATSVSAPPIWTVERLTISSTSPREWETLWPNDPQAFPAPSMDTLDWEQKFYRNHLWNLSVQTAMPLKSALTLTYQGKYQPDVITSQWLNELPPGQYSDIQAARPIQPFSTIRIGIGARDSWYNAFKLMWERRFASGLSFSTAYCFSKDIARVRRPAGTPFAPVGYDDGRSSEDRTHILTFNEVYHLPFGSGRRYSTQNSVINALFGGWQVSGIYNFTSGAPISLVTPGATLGNGFNTRPNVVGDPKLQNPSADRWFNPLAFAAPARYTFGNSGIGIIDAPGFHTLDLGLMKSFHFNEERYLQVRWEMFNAPNHVNLGSPITTIGLPATGQILSAGPARQMQIGLKFVF